MDESGRKGAGGDTPAKQKGIFSSPDLAVNSENLEDIKPELSEDDKSRIASAFAQTDATQKRDQLSEQMAEQDVISGTVLPAGSSGSNNGGFGGGAAGGNSTASTATGDIHIPGAKKKSKLPLILLALIVLTAVVGGVVWFAQNNMKQEESQTPAQAFEAYRLLVTKGPSSQENDVPTGDEWFLFAVDDSGMSSAEQTQYLNDVSSRFNEYLSISSKDTLNGLSELNVKYAQVVNLVVAGKNLNGLSLQVLNKYIEEGAEAARSYTDQLIAQLSESITSLPTQSVANGIIRYIENDFSAIEIYQQHNCIVDGEIDYIGCEVGLTTISTTLNLVLDARLSAEQTVRDNLPILEQQLQTQTNEITKLLADKSHE